MSGEVDERVLVARARDGSTDAFEVLVRRTRDRVFAVALRLTSDRQAAEDVTQETYLKAWTTLRSFRGDSSLQTWLYRIVINEAHNQRRRLPGTQPLPDADSPLAPSDSSADQQVVAEQRRAAVADAIAELPMRYRAPLVLHYFAGCSYAEVGRILSLSEVAAKVRVHRARRALTDRLQAWR